MNNLQWAAVHLQQLLHVHRRLHLLLLQAPRLFWPVPRNRYDDHRGHFERIGAPPGL